MSVQESVGDVELVGRPLLVRDETQDGADRRRLDDGGESLPKIDAGSLAVTTDNPTRFPSVRVCRRRRACI
jgi:hypothetical protein